MPDGLAPGYYEVHVAVNGVDFGATGVGYDALPAPAVLALQPDFGPASGLTRVTVTGQHFADTRLLACQFGNLTAPAYVLEPAAV